MASVHGTALLALEAIASSLQIGQHVVCRGVFLGVFACVCPVKLCVCAFLAGALLWFLESDYDSRTA